ncbi:MAG: hypothetical protein EHM28_15635 [Spirochaetaceae bacterium]|nr:MAG: hypothetical protein EHM28_15635 [Spirochaetaceae bacterium]
MNGCNDRSTCGNRGDATFIVFAIFLVFSLLFAALGFFARDIISFVVIKGDYFKKEKVLREVSAQVIALIARDNKPDSDSKFDDMWGRISLLETENLKISVRDASSLINPNFAFENLLVTMNVFAPGTNYAKFHELRTVTGPVTGFSSSFGETFSEEALEKFLSPWSYCNVNLANETMVFRYYAQRTGKKVEDQPFFAAFREKRRNNVFISEKSLATMLGQDYIDVFPVLFAKPQYNINYIDEKILANILHQTSRDYTLKLPEDLAEQLVVQRSSGALTANDLVSLIKPKFKGTILEHYFGAVTWFWEIRVKQNSLELVTIAARVPVDPQTAGANNKEFFRIVKEEFNR